MLDNRYLYILGGSLDSSIPTDYSYELFGYSIDANTGALSLITTLPRVELAVAGNFVIHPSGRFLVFHYNEMEDNHFRLQDHQIGIRVIAIDPLTGELSEAAGSPFAKVPGDFGSVPGVFDHSGEHYYTFSFRRDEDSHLTTVAASYELDLVTGNLQVMTWQDLPLVRPGSSAVSANTTSEIVIDPTGQFVVLTRTTYGVGHSASTPNVVGVATLASIDQSTGELVISEDPGYVQNLNGVTAPLIDRSGEHIYLPSPPDLPRSGGAVYSNAGAITVLEVDSGTRALSEISGSPFSTNGFDLQNTLLDPTGTLLMATNGDSGAVAVLAIDPDTGALSHLEDSPVTPVIGANPVVTVDPSASFAFTVDSDSSSVSVYALDRETGTLTFVGSELTGTGALAAVVVGLQY